jgi:cytosine/adenosine deaminase-related metal-dependent hydrolase
LVWRIARAARSPDYGIAPGNKADLVVLGAPSVHEALRLQPPRRHVIKNGGRNRARDRHAGAAVTNSFKSAMQKAGDIFDASFLPPAAERKAD